MIYIACNVSLILSWCHTSIKLFGCNSFFMVCHSLFVMGQSQYTLVKYIQWYFDGLPKYLYDIPWFTHERLSSPADHDTRSLYSYMLSWYTIQPPWNVLNVLAGSKLSGCGQFGQLDLVHWVGTYHCLQACTSVYNWWVLA